MENRQLITLGNRNKSISRMKQSSHISILDGHGLEGSQHYRTPTEPLFQSQHPVRLMHSPSTKENAFMPPHCHTAFGQSNVQRDNSVLVSQQSFYNLPVQQSRVVESKEKSRGNLMMETVTVKSRNGSPVNQSNSRSKVVMGESQKNLLTLTLNQGAKQVQLSNKIKLLEQVISQKQVENQQLQGIVCQERNESHQLRTKVQNLSKENEQSKARISELEEMLEREISKSLQLMDSSENLSKEVEDIRAELLVKDTLVKTLQEEMGLSQEKIAAIEKEIEQLKTENEGKVQKLTSESECLKIQLESVIAQMKARLNSLQSQLSTLTCTLHQKQSLITELQAKYNSKLKSLQSSLSQKEIQLSSFTQNLQKQSKEIQSLQVQLQSTKTIPRSLQHQMRPQLEQDKTAECKKCKELLQTVFKLNSYLNKK